MKKKTTVLLLFAAGLLLTSWSSCHVCVDCYIYDDSYSRNLLYNEKDCFNGPTSHDRSEEYESDVRRRYSSYYVDCIYEGG